MFPGWILAALHQKSKPSTVWTVCWYSDSNHPLQQLHEFDVQVKDPIHIVTDIVAWCWYDAIYSSALWLMQCINTVMQSHDLALIFYDDVWYFMMMMVTSFRSVTCIDQYCSSSVFSRLWWLSSIEEHVLMNSKDWEVCCSSIDESVEQMISSIDQQQNRLKRQVMLLWLRSWCDSEL